VSTTFVTDGMSADVIFLEIHLMYAALLVSGTPIPLSDPPAMTITSSASTSTKPL
jgi:hypothetical protein